MKVLAWIAVVAMTAVIVVATVLLVVRADKRMAFPADPVRRKMYSRAIAEGVRYRDFESLGIDRLSFKACRIEKRRKGAVVFGAFNVMVVEDLTLNIAVGPIQGRTQQGPSSRQEQGLGSADLEGLLAHIYGSGGTRVSGVRFERVQVNRCLKSVVSRVFEAAQAESRMGVEGLLLHRCRVFDSRGAVEEVEKARLIFRPVPTLVYESRQEEKRIPLSAEAMGTL